MKLVLTSAAVIGLILHFGYLLTVKHSFTGAYSPGRTFDLPFRGFLITHIQTHGRTSLDERSARRRDLCIHRTTQHINTTDKHPCPERDSNPATPATTRPQTYASRPRGHWDRHSYSYEWSKYYPPHKSLFGWRHALSQDCQNIQLLVKLRTKEVYLCSMYS
jgi:hypothetical protein